jgi:PAS domain S-box-containing protein
MDSSARRYLLGWAVFGLAGAVALLLAQPLSTDRVTSTLVLAAIALLAERVKLAFDFDRTEAAYSVIEVAATAGLLLLGPAPALVGILLGTVLAHISRQLGTAKIVFNASVTVVGMSLAGFVMSAMPAVGPLIGGRPVLGAALGMLGYVGINLAAIFGLVARLAGPTATEGMRDQIPLTALTVIGQIATGVVLAVVATTDPWLAPLVLAPVGAIHLAARGATRTATLLSTLRADRDRLIRVVDGASDGILLLDAAGLIQVWNPAMTELTGIPDDEAIGRPIAAVLDAQVRTGPAGVEGRWLIDTAHEGPPQRELSAALQHRDGTSKAIQESHALVFDTRGRCTGDVIVVRDVSRQHELERLRSDFVARVSHELRTPLTPIRGFASVLLRRGESLTPEKRHEALERILERADHLGTLVEDLLLVTRVDQGELAELVHVRPTGVDTVIQAAVNRARAKVPERPITGHTEPGTPDALADPDRTAQVLDALLDNACRYSPEGSPVDVLVDHQGDDVRIRVVDHGPGIPRDQRDTIFERFHRLEDPLTMRTGGVGLGLFLARQLAEAMHGSLVVATPGSGPGGTVFALRLPTAEPDATAGDQTA